MKDEVRVCRTCLLELPIEKYGVYTSPNGTKHRRKQCYQCRRNHEAALYRANPAVAERFKKSARLHHIKKTYNLNEDELNELKLKQNHRCAICKLEKPLCVDHVHATGDVHAPGDIRGLLCRACNFGIGYFHDSVEKLQSAILYLNKHHGKH